MSTRDIAGKTIEFDEDGFMEDSSAWNKDVAVVLADEIGITPLSDRHWTVIEFCRADFEKEGEAPTLRRITVEAASRCAHEGALQTLPQGTGEEGGLHFRFEETDWLHLVDIGSENCIRT